MIEQTSNWGLIIHERNLMDQFYNKWYLTIIFDELIVD